MRRRRKIELDTIVDDSLQLNEEETINLIEKSENSEMFEEITRLKSIKEYFQKNFFSKILKNTKVL